MSCKHHKNGEIYGNVGGQCLPLRKSMGLRGARSSGNGWESCASPCFTLRHLKTHLLNAMKKSRPKGFGRFNMKRGCHQDGDQPQQKMTPLIGNMVEFTNLNQIHPGIFNPNQIFPKCPKLNQLEDVQNCSVDPAELHPPVGWRRSGDRDCLPRVSSCQSVQQRLRSDEKHHPWQLAKAKLLNHIIFYMWWLPNMQVVSGNYDWKLRGYLHVFHFFPTQIDRRMMLFGLCMLIIAGWYPSIWWCLLLFGSFHWALHHHPPTWVRWILGQSPTKLDNWGGHCIVVLRKSCW